MYLKYNRIHLNAIFFKKKQKNTIWFYRLEIKSLLYLSLYWELRPHREYVYCNINIWWKKSIYVKIYLISLERVCRTVPRYFLCVERSTSWITSFPSNKGHFMSRSSKPARRSHLVLLNSLNKCRRGFISPALYAKRRYDSFLFKRGWQRTLIPV